MKLCLGDRDQWPDSTLVDRGRAMPATRPTARTNKWALTVAVPLSPVSGRGATSGDDVAQQWRGGSGAETMWA